MLDQLTQTYSSENSAKLNSILLDGVEN